MFIKQLWGTRLEAPVPTWLFSGVLGCPTSETTCRLRSRGGRLEGSGSDWCLHHRLTFARVPNTPVVTGLGSMWAQSLCVETH